MIGKLWIQESLLNRIDETFPILQAGILRLHPNEIYNLHVDQNRGVCVNMQLNYNVQSECSFEVPGKTVIVPYEEHSFFLFNNQQPHKVVNGDNTRYMFSIEFVKNKNELDYNLFYVNNRNYDLFLCKIDMKELYAMDKDKLKLIVRNLELLVDSLKTELYSDVQAYQFDDIKPKDLDYDEIFEDSE
jgi:hypothetical protein